MAAEGPHADPGARYKITPYETSKQNIPQRPAMEAGVVLKHPHSWLMCGKSGSGKTQFVLNMLKKPIYYAGYFDEIFLFSDSAKEGADDLYRKHLRDEIKQEHIFAPDDEGVEQLEHIIAVQKQKIEEAGGDHAKTDKLLFIFDDVAHARKFLASPAYKQLHIMNRHLNASCWSLTQSYVAIPRQCRIQVGGVVFYHGATDTEKERFSDEHTPSNHNWREFRVLIDDATRDKYNFMFVNKQVDDHREQYRHGLDVIMELKK